MLKGGHLCHAAVKFTGYSVLKGREEDDKEKQIDQQNKFTQFWEKF
jgi:hypothetical protein